MFLRTTTNMILAGSMLLMSAIALSAGTAEADLYFNSSEAVCDPNDSTMLWCDDFEDGTFMETCEGGGASCCTGSALCQANGAGRENPNNDGWLGNIFTSWPDPAGTAWARCGGVGASSNCAGTSGVLSGPAGGRVMGRKRFAPNDREVNEIYVRWYVKQLPGFEMGHEKMMTFEDKGGGYRPVILSKYFGSGCVRMVNKTPAGGDYPQNLGNQLCLTNDRWYYLEMRINISSGIYELWMDDCGQDGTGCNGSAGTKRASHSGIDFGSGLLGATWLENWGNASSQGEQYYDQMAVSTRRIGPIGGSPSPSPPPPAAPAPPLLLD